MADGKVVGLDIGTSMIRVAIGEIDPDTGNGLPRTTKNKTTENANENTIR